ncbi:hypothetical protein [Nocardia iowensis]|uniref:Uncharacterized protein n=1 Tax=Nocardia iowensis TaxID=204891 RepID=A0ABX8RUB7_NOCIO|nr:hypothetical protein KV110_09100 [Nocardia iowensis]
MNLALLWATALPDYFDAAGGRTPNGDPIGNLWYTIACFVIAIATVLATFLVPQGKSHDEGTRPAVQPTATHTA